MDDTTALKAILVGQEEAWRAGDAAAFARSAAAAIVFTNVVGLFSVGRDPFEAQHRHIFETFYKGSALQQFIEQISFVQPDVAIVNTRTKVTGFGTLPPVLQVQTVDGALTTRLEQVLVRTNDAWQVVAFHNTIVNPRAEATAPSA